MEVSWTPELSQPWISRVIVLSSVTSCADQPVLATWPGAGTGLQAAAVHRVFAQPLCNHLHHRVWGFTTTTCLLPPLMVSYWPQCTWIMFNIHISIYMCILYLYNINMLFGPVRLQIEAKHLKWEFPNLTSCLLYIYLFTKQTITNIWALTFYSPTSVKPRGKQLKQGHRNTNASHIYIVKIQIIIRILIL